MRYYNQRFLLGFSNVEATGFRVRDKRVIPLFHCFQPKPVTYLNHSQTQSKNEEKHKEKV